MNKSSEKMLEITVIVSDREVARGHNALKEALRGDRMNFGIKQNPQNRTVAKRLILAGAKIKENA